MMMVSGGVTAAQGFTASGCAAGIKRSGKLDLGLIYSPTTAKVAAVFTVNSIKAAPLLVSMEHARTGGGQAVLVNSGNANCYTGAQGLQHAQDSTALMARLLGIKAQSVLVTSTGIIGKPLPYQNIVAAVPALIKGLSKKGGAKFAQAILTTDLKPKEIAAQIKLGGKTVTIGACAKGSGMIEPKMATMLGFITTDAAISLGLLKSALKSAVDRSFNSITVDGCMSTNDMVTIHANGAAGNAMITKPDEDFKKFYQALEFICVDLAKKIVQDGEGATKFITIEVLGAASGPQAKQIAKAIANSALVKTAAFGCNANWGRVGAAVGSLGLKGIDENSMKITFSPFDRKHIVIKVALSLGKARATVFTCDLSYDYVRINAAYN